MTPEQQKRIANVTASLEKLADHNPFESDKFGFLELGYDKITDRSWVKETSIGTLTVSLLKERPGSNALFEVNLDPWSTQFGCVVTHNTPTRNFAYSVQNQLVSFLQKSVTSLFD